MDADMIKATRTGEGPGERPESTPRTITVLGEMATDAFSVETVIAEQITFYKRALFYAQKFTILGLGKIVKGVFGFLC